MFKRKSENHFCHALISLLLLIFFSPQAGAQNFANFESPHVHPLDITPSGDRVLAVNTADNRLEVFTVTPAGLEWSASIPVGLEPVSVRVRNEDEAWVVNHLSDTVSIVNLQTGRVRGYVATGDEPCDVVFAGKPVRAFVSISQENRLEVFDPSDLGIAPVFVPIAGEDPRALVTDGTLVHALIFEAGNGTTIIKHEVVDSNLNPYPGNPNPPPNDGRQFDPPLTPGIPAPPRVSLILRKNADGQWMDDNGHDWSSAVTWDLHGHGMAVVDATDLSVAYQTGLMSTNMASAIAPDGEVAVVGTEAFNEIRFEPVLNGVFMKVEGALLAPGVDAPDQRVDLNPHLDYTEINIPWEERLDSIGDPRGVVFTPSGDQIWVSGLGSSNLAVFDDDFNRIGRVDIGEGPTGLVMNQAGDRVYVLNRFDGSVSVVTVESMVEVARVPFYDPTPQFIKDGRPFLYDTILTSGLGHVSCASCHVDGRIDQLAWDLGDPSGVMEPNELACNILLPLPGDCEDFHPMKGPMVTQTLVGIVGVEPLHWRGDRQDLAAFSHAFTGLLGGDGNGLESEMAEMEAFLGSIKFPPNPNRNIDNSLPDEFEGADPINGRIGFLDGNLDTINCNACHKEPTGTLPSSISPVLLPGTQAMKIPHLRNMYERRGMDKTSMEGGKGFGFEHDGISDTMFNFLEFEQFLFPHNPVGQALQRDVAAFMMCWDSGTHAGIGAQAQLGGEGSDEAAAMARRDMLLGEALKGEADLVVRAVVDGELRGYLLLPDGSFQSDVADEIVEMSSIDELATPDEPVIYTLVVSGTGIRIALDRDGDGHFDTDEIRSCSDPADPASTPGSNTPCGVDLDGNGMVDAADIGLLLAAWGLCSPEGPCPADFDGNGLVDAADLGILLASWTLNP